MSKRSKQAVSEVKLEKAMVYLLLALRKLQFQLASFRFLALSLQFLALEITSTTASFENAVSKFPRHHFDKGRNMHTDKLFLLDLSEKTSLGGELAGGEVVSWWRDSLVAR